MNYATFLEQKKRVFLGDGLRATTADLPAVLYDWQAAVTRWALKKGRAAIFADCGLGKTFMQVAWAHALSRAYGVRAIIFAPLCVAEQTVEEATKLGVSVCYVRNQSEADAVKASNPSNAPLVITNYERLDSFDADQFGAVVLDESSILKSFDGKTRTKVIETFHTAKYRLCCTATPSPNDIAELANHSEFLGLMTRPEFLATWFVHDDVGWRMKRHAVQPFYRWLASWAVAFRKPSDLGYSDEGFILPALSIRDEIVPNEDYTGGALFPELGLKGLSGRLAARRGSLAPRVAAVARMAHTGLTGQRHTSCQWIVWCGLNPEAEAIAEAIPDAVNVQGSDSYAEKRGAVDAFLRQDIRVLVSKVKIAGYGMNFQNCHHMAFLGLGDSFESYYQAIRRCWRYGQQHAVTAHVVVSDAERAVVENVRRKEVQYSEMTSALLEHMKDFEREEIAS